MRRMFCVLLAVILLVSTLMACGQKAAPTAAPQAKLKVVLLLNGVLGDKAFFDSARRGADRAIAELGCQIRIIEAGIDPARWESALEDAAASGDYDVLICGTWQMNEYLAKVAPKYPSKKFIIFDTTVDYTKGNLGNVYSVLYKQNEGSYLAGVYAAAMTQKPLDGMNDKKIIGVIGGQDIPVINDFILGYKQGAAAVDPATQVIVQYAGSWDDPAKGKEITLAMYEQGADIVFNVASGTGLGIFEAAQEKGRYAIGVDSDQAMVIKDANPAQAGRILTSMMKNVDNSLFRALKMHLEGTLKYGAAENLGIPEGGVGLAKNEFYDKLTPADVKATVEQAEKDVVAGKIKVDTAF